MNTLIGKKQDGSRFVALVLGPADIAQLQQHDPIIVKVEEMFPDGVPKGLELAVFYNETPVTNSAELLDCVRGVG